MSQALETDLYQLTMIAGYWTGGLTGSATFELFIRQLPEPRGYLIAAGLEQALAYLEHLRFDDDDRRWLKQLRALANVPAVFFDEYLAGFAFHGDVWAMAEGTPVFANEPILRVTAPLPEAQLVETALLATIAFQTSVATKASRIVGAARGRPVVEFGARRAHGPGAALLAARAAYIGGCDATSYVEASREFGIAPSGTMAHSWVQAFRSEADAFRAYHALFSDAVYLLDTYDTIRAAETLVAAGLHPSAVRLDSGDLVPLSRAVRRILDRAGLTDTRIFATGDLDEYAIARLLEGGAAVDAFGVGTSLTTVNDAPALPAVYKLVEIERPEGTAGVIKLSPGKRTWPGPKQVWRAPSGDVIAAADEPGTGDTRALLAPVMRGGRRLAPCESLDEIRRRCREQVDALPDGVRRLDAPDTYPVSVSPILEHRRAALADARSEVAG